MSERLATEITRGFPHHFKSTPLARPLWEVTRCSQGTIGGSRLQGLGGHTAGEDRLGITGANSPPPIESRSLLDRKRHTKRGRRGGKEGRSRRNARTTKGAAGACGVVRPQRVSRSQKSIQFKTRRDSKSKKKTVSQLLSNQGTET